ncbi:hypothetical protein V1514DRAFT_321365 [Lipomyces japonicus]|uniref:uncharacterized protein n=1 Tax=Lipomyces japonicus TaxID=56871 RepID=UPI0034CE03AD
MPFYGQIQLRGQQRVENTFDPSFRHLSPASPIGNAIFIYHPGYEPGEDLLFKLFAPDHRRDGWLSTDRDGENRVNGDFDDVLGLGNYWYHLPLQGAKWSFVKCFEDWKFPSSLPPSWSRLRNSLTTRVEMTISSNLNAIHIRDHTCRVTAYTTRTEVAYIIPWQQLEWFNKNSMRTWCENPAQHLNSIIDDHGNLMLLRSDVYKAFDDKEFVFYPKDDAGVCIHMMMPSPDIGVLYHNAKSHPIALSRSEFLFVQFAWTLFSLILAFQQKPALKNFHQKRYNTRKRTREAAKCSEVTAEGEGTSAKSQVRLLQTQQENLDPAVS